MKEKRPEHIASPNAEQEIAGPLSPGDEEIISIESELSIALAAEDHRAIRILKEVLDELYEDRDTGAGKLPSAVSKISQSNAPGEPLPALSLKKKSSPKQEKSLRQPSIKPKEILVDIDMNDSLKVYLASLKRPPLTAEEEKILAIDYRDNHNIVAFNELVDRNRGLVIKVAQRYPTSVGLSFLDLIQEGNLGLIIAAERFDPDKGYKFSTYAIWWILHKVSRAVYDQSDLIRKPVHIVQDGQKYRKTKDKLANQLLREPSENEIREVLIEQGLITDPKRILLVQKSLGSVSSLEKPISSEADSDEIQHFIANQTPTPEEEVENALLADDLNRAIRLSDLSPKEKRVIKKRFGLNGEYPHTLEEIGRELGVCRERIRQIEEKAMEKLKEHPRIKKLLQDYLE